MQLMLFDEKNSWIKITEDFRIKVDYCTIKQQMKLHGLLNYYLTDKEKSDEESSAFFEYASYFVKYHLKDWEGVTDGKKEIPFVVVNDEMDDILWKGLINNTEIFWKVYTAIFDKLRFNEIDKKK